MQKNKGTPLELLKYWDDCIRTKIDPSCSKLKKSRKEPGE